MILGISGYFYTTLGAYAEFDKPQVSNNDPRAGMNPDQTMAQRIQMMETQSKSEPNNSQLLFNLGHLYVSAGQYDDAVSTFDKTMVLAGTHAELLGPKATAMYYQANQTVTPAVQAVIDKALSLDPKDPSTLLLVGMNSFFTGQYEKSINAWQIILDTGRDDVDRSSIMNAIESAKMRMQSDMGEMPDDTAHSQVKTVADTVIVEVSISPELAAQVDSNDMLFIFARNVEGDPVPLAVTKISAKILPVTIVLDDTTSMSSDAKLSLAKNVEIIAILSKHGSVQPKAGDMQGKVNMVKVGSTAQLVIDTLVH